MLVVTYVILESFLLFFSSHQNSLLFLCVAIMTVCEKVCSILLTSLLFGVAK